METSSDDRERFVAAARRKRKCAPISRRILGAAGGPVNLDRQSLGVDSRVDQVKRDVRAGLGEQPRALADDPRLLVLINPTAGVDVRSKEFLLGKVEETAESGTGVLIASDELDDLRMCDRILVMFQGRVTTEIPRGWHDHDLVAAMEGVDLNA